MNDGSVKMLKFNALRVWIEFDLLVDIDYGLIAYIAQNFADDRLFYLNNLFADHKIVKGDLYLREVYNPLEPISKESVEMASLDSLYDQFFERYKVKILEEACITDIYNVAKAMILSDSGTLVSIICKDQYEVDIINRILPQRKKNRDWDIILHDSNEDNLDARDCDSLMVKYSKNLFKYSHIEGKVIYLADLRCNIDKKVWETTHSKYPNMDATLYFENNEVKFIQMYAYNSEYSDDDEFYEFEEEEEYVEHNRDGSVHYRFEDDPDVSHSDVEMLKEWLSPQELQDIEAKSTRKKGIVSDADDFEEVKNPYGEMTRLLYDEYD